MQHESPDFCPSSVADESNQAASATQVGRHAAPATHPANIASVERDTGLAKDTLRVWERRYGFPQPVRDVYGERVYPPAQVEKLRLMRHLIDQGHRPGKIVTLEAGELQELVARGARHAKTDASQGHEELMHYIDLCKQCQFEQLRDVLWHELRERGMRAFVIEIAAPLNVMVGELWARGDVAVYEEHFYTESMQGVLRGGIAALLQTPVKRSDHPRVLLTTFPQEEHGLGLLMAEALLTLAGARCMNLGVRTPILEIARAATMQKADIVALSFSAAMNTNQMASGVRDLRSVLPQEIEIWAGGACLGLRRRPPSELHVLDLWNVAREIENWHVRHAKAGWVE